MSDAIVVLNAGSSSIKFSLFLARGKDLEMDIQGQASGIYTQARFEARGPDGAVRGETRWPEGDPPGHEGAMDHIITYLRSELGGNRLLGLGHRVVHGGQEFRQPVRVDEQVLKALETFIPLAPLHQPHNLAPIRRALSRAPELPQVACFDTAFHRSLPQVAQMYALPAELQAAGVIRYGFHGLSYEYIASRLPALDPAAAAGRCIVLHLGNGASMCALREGRSVESTMGFTAVEGLPMGTRSGALDPGILLYLITQKGYSAAQIEALIYNRAGLLGVSGISSDMRALLASDDPRARLAVEFFVYRVRCALGALAAALGGLDAIVFTAGIGENAPAIRSRVCRDARWLGVELDEAANAAGQGRISTPASRVAVWVVPTNEELMIARHTWALLSA